MIKQLLHALIDNSVKYTPNARRHPAWFFNGRYACVLSVSDDGIRDGCPNTATHLRAVLSRRSGSRTRTGGMGLAFPRSVIAEAHNGYVSAVSQPGAGQPYPCICQIT
jgi:signal transduction histidine kinase